MTAGSQYRIRKVNVPLSSDARAGLDRAATVAGRSVTNWASRAIRYCLDYPEPVFTRPQTGPAFLYADFPAALIAQVEEHLRGTDVSITQFVTRAIERGLSESPPQLY